MAAFPNGKFRNNVNLSHTEMVKENVGNPRDGRHRRRRQIHMSGFKSVFKTQLWSRKQVAERCGQGDDTDDSEQ